MMDKINQPTENQTWLVYALLFNFFFGIFTIEADQKSSDWLPCFIKEKYLTPLTVEYETED